MTKEKLEARKAEAEQHKTQLIAQVNMTQGIIGECDYWLAELEKSEPTAAEPAAVDDVLSDTDTHTPKAEEG